MKSNFSSESVVVVRNSAAEEYAFLAFYVCETVLRITVLRKEWYYHPEDKLPERVPICRSSYKGSFEGPGVLSGSKSLRLHVPNTVRIDLIRLLKVFLFRHFTACIP